MIKIIIIIINNNKQLLVSISQVSMHLKIMKL